MKIEKKIKILGIILIFVTITFTLLGTYNLYEFKEGHTNPSTPSDDNIPKCSNSLEEDEDEINQNWFIKSSLVPPVCTSCPYYNSNTLTSNNNVPSSSNSSNNPSSNTNPSNTNPSNNTQSVTGSIIAGNKGDDNSVNNNIEQSTTSDYYNKTMNVNMEKTQNDNSLRQDNSNKQNINMDNSVNQDLSQRESADSKFNNLFGNNSIMFGSFGGGGSGSNTINSTNPSSNKRNNDSGLLPVSTPASAGNTNLLPYQESNNIEGTSLINNLRTTITKLNQQIKENSKGECPPCPACERCPEPSFECKKVPNYRSPQIDNYMPVPILNDFSRF